MIVVDPRSGSKNMVGLFPKDLTLSFELPAADILLAAPNGDFWTGIEHKRINDLLTSIETGRFAGHQLPMLHETYDDYWLLVEGPYRRGPDDEILVPHGWKRGEWIPAKGGGRTFHMWELEKWMFTMMTLTPLKIWTVQGRMETRDWIMQVAYPWWEKGKDKHRSHLQTDKSRVTAEILKASLLRRVAEQLPGIGFKKAFAVEGHYGNTFEMCVADWDEWVKIEGVGAPMAKRIVEAIHGRERET